MKIDLSEKQYQMVLFCLGYTGQHTLHDELEKKYGK